MAGSYVKHEDIGQIDWLLGKWRSIKAEVLFTNMPTRTYDDDVEFSHDGRGFLTYRSDTKFGEEPVHTECGYLMVNPENKELALVVAHFVGYTEISTGKVSGKKITLKNESITRTSFTPGSQLTDVLRVWELQDDDTLKNTTSMGTEADPFHEHLHVVYKRVKN